MSIQWDIRGWKRLTVHDDPPLVAARKEFLAWLAEVPEAHRADLDARLRSDLDDAHLSARLELFVHHYFRSNGREPQIHPKVAHSSNRPDFLVDKGDATLLVECKSVFDKPAIAQQDQRLRQLATEAGRKLERTVILNPLSNLPPNIPARRIRGWIERLQIPNDGPDVMEFDFWDNHQGHHYGLRTILPRINDGGEGLTGVQGLMSQAQTVTIGELFRKGLMEKAGKYGQLDFPYLIALSAETKFPARTKHEFAALFGNIVLNLHADGQVSETRKPNGLFTLIQNGEPRYKRVSGVLVYRFKWTESGHEHRIHIYHNPYAAKPIDPGLFPDISQFVRQDKDRMAWTNGAPELY